ncbi:chromate resistance protein ChrB domain-containing protein [Thermodesulfobacteriota bacterium]
MKKKLSFILIYIAFFGTVNAGEKVFSTWDGFEVDKLASIWLIKRFIAPNATVIIYPKNQAIDRGIQFDTPHSKIKRKYNKSTFESLLEHYHLSDIKLVNMGKLINDVEINVWEEKVFRRSKEIEIIIMDLLDRYKSNEELIDMASEYFDRLYKGLPENLERNPR